MVIIITTDIYWVHTMSHCIKCFTTERDSWLSWFCFHLCLCSGEVKRDSSWPFLLLSCEHFPPSPTSLKPIAVHWKAPVRVEWETEDHFPACSSAGIIGWQPCLSWKHPSLSSLGSSLTFHSPTSLFYFSPLKLKRHWYGGREDRGLFWGNCIDKSVSTCRQHDDVIQILIKVFIFSTSIFFDILAPESSHLVT